MTRRTLVITEYAPSARVSLSVTERDMLRGMINGLTVEPVAGSTDTYTIRGKSSVGVVRVGDLTVELRPKVGIAAVLFLVSYALDPKAWRNERAELQLDLNLAEAIVPLFAGAVQMALRPGLLHGYCGQEDTLTTVRGRVRMAEQMRARTGLPMPVEVAYDEFTPDILENRLLRTAVDILGRLRLRHNVSRHSLARLHQQLNGINPLAVDGRGVSEPVWTRLNERYRASVSLARLIVTGAGLEARSGGQDASGFVVDMNAVFEAFVRVALREHLHLDAARFPAGSGVRRLFLDAGHSVALEPDLSWWVGGRCVFVGDCKYKRTVTGVPNADVYQMLAYLTALDLPEGLLVYAAGEDSPRDIVIERTGRRIHIRTIDVTLPPDEVLDQVGALADLVRESAFELVASTSVGST